ncbi:MAG: hypothetical protein ABIS06_00390 [Vicinamibacterales bacterium]
MLRTVIASTLAIVAADVSTPRASQTEWKYTALGDSTATGYLATSGYVPRYRMHLEADNAVMTTLTTSPRTAPRAPGCSIG